MDLYTHVGARASHLRTRACDAKIDGKDHDTPLMLLLTYSYVVPKDKRTEHARLLHRMRQVMARLGLDHFEAYEQVGKHWSGGDGGGRVVQILRFRDKTHFSAIQAAEKNDPGAQQLIAEFCELVNLPYQQQTGMFADGYYSSLIATASARPPSLTAAGQEPSPLTPEPEDTVPLSEQVGGEPQPPESGDASAPVELADERTNDVSEVPPPPVGANGEPDVFDYLSEPGPAGEGEAGDESRR